MTKKGDSYLFPREIGSCPHFSFYSVYSGAWPVMMQVRVLRSPAAA
jgi:hypothetical protein